MRYKYQTRRIIALQMSSNEDPTRRKSTTNESGRKTTKIDPKDIEQIRKNVRSNVEEREEEEEKGGSTPSSSFD